MNTINAFYTNYKHFKSFINNYNKNYNKDTKFYYNNKTKKFITERGAKTYLTKNKNYTDTLLNGIVFIHPKIINEEIYTQFLTEFENIDIQPVKRKLNFDLIPTQTKIEIKEAVKELPSIELGELGNRINTYNLTQDDFTKPIIPKIFFYIYKLTEHLRGDNQPKIYVRAITIDDTNTSAKPSIINIPLNIDSIAKLIERGDTTTEQLDSFNALVFNRKFIQLNLFRSKRNTYNTTEGAFFKFTHNLKLDLKILDIYNKEELEYSCIDNCLYKAFHYSNLFTEDELNLLSKYNLSNMNMIDIKTLKKISDKLKVNIIIKQLWDTSIKKAINIGKYDKTINIGLIDNHYFLIIDIKGITAYALKQSSFNPLDIKTYNIEYNSKSKRSSITDDPICNSFDLVSLLIKNKEKLLSPIDQIDYSRKTKKLNINNIDDLTTHESNFKQFEKTKAKELIPRNQILYFDFETTTITGTHKPIIYSIIGDKFNSSYSINPTSLPNEYDEDIFNLLTDNVGKRCLDDMIQYAVSNKLNKIYAIAHNANFDTMLIIKHIKNINSNYITKNNSLVIFKGLYKGIEINICDSFNHISKPLKDIPGMLKIDELEKEVLPYQFFNEYNNLVNSNITLKQLYSELQKENKQSRFLEFVNNCKSKGLLDQDPTSNSKINMMTYNELYCIQDTEILKNIWEKYTYLIQSTDLFKGNDNLIEPLLYPTISSLSTRIVQNNDCYNGLYSLNGTPREFISRCIVGGRCMTKQNKKIYLPNSNRKIMCYDACSLYPSSMFSSKGWLRGTPKVINDNELDIDYLDNNSDGYFVEIKILEINKKLNMPILSIVNKDGVREFTNDLIGECVCVDNITLKDFLQYQKAKVKILKGYKYDEGFNTNIKELMEKLYNMRKYYKDLENPLQEVIKLVMNSAYGKTILKPITDTTIYFDSEEDCFKYTDKNFNSILPFEKIEEINKFKVEQIKPINEHYNYSHIGTQVLSQSKHIMNKVVCLAEDLNIDIFYTDTDSIYLYEDQIQILENEFEKIYGYKLKGKNLMNFHEDLEVKGYNRIYATEAIFNGKKNYALRLTAQKLNEQGKIVDEIETFKFKLKGITDSAILFRADELKVDIIELYKMMNNEEGVEFDLLKTLGESKIKMKCNDFGYNNLTEFKRKIKV